MTIFSLLSNFSKYIENLAKILVTLSKFYKVYFSYNLNNPLISHISYILPSVGVGKKREKKEGNMERKQKKICDHNVFVTYHFSVNVPRHINTK